MDLKDTLLPPSGTQVQTADANADLATIGQLRHCDCHDSLDAALLILIFVKLGLKSSRVTLQLKEKIQARERFNLRFCIWLQGVDCVI